MIKHLRTIFLLVILISASASAQDVPLFTQKLTNSFLYNPSVAGNSIGSLTLSHRQYWSGALDAPSTNFFSAHTPFGKYRFGTGINFYQDRLGVTENLYASAAFAYHVKITDEKKFSMGLSAEYDNQRLNPKHYDAVDADDYALNQSGSLSSVDFSFGVSFTSRYFSIGGSANRLKALTGVLDSANAFPAYYSGTARFAFPLAGERDLFEPMVTFRGFAQGSNQIDAGLFYTYNDFLTLGGSYRTGGSGVVNVTAGIKILKAVTIGYSRDLYMGDVSKGVGATNEFTLRFDYMNEAFYTKVRNSKVINTRALALRRKTLSNYKYRGSPNSHSKHYQRTIKRKSYMSPNYRMESSKKLQTMRRKTKSTYKRKPVRRKR
jgi:type IX secretion system PorP/SprF family membrane protein